MWGNMSFCISCMGTSVPATPNKSAILVCKNSFINKKMNNSIDIINYCYSSISTIYYLFSWNILNITVNINLKLAASII